VELEGILIMSSVYVKFIRETVDDLAKNVDELGEMIDFNPDMGSEGVNVYLALDNVREGLAKHLEDLERMYDGFSKKSV